MRNVSKIALFVVLVVLAGCSSPATFSGYRQEKFALTRVTESETKTVQILNDSSTGVLHVISYAFYGSSNEAGHFQVISARIAGEKVGTRDLFIPPLSALELDIQYAPLNLDTTESSFAGWTTTVNDRWEPIDLYALDDGNEVEGEVEGEVEAEVESEDRGAVAMMVNLTGVSPFTLRQTQDERSNQDHTTGNRQPATSNKDQTPGQEEFLYAPAIHRAMLIVAFDSPRDGYADIELVGGAIPGPNGETTATGGVAGGGECTAEGSTACFSGTFSIDLPGLMSGGALEVPLGSPILFATDGSVVDLDMNTFPPILIALVGNGPGEPLEGKPVDAVSIIISGTPDTKAAGSFDGQNLSLADVSFRIRVLLGEITYEDINPGLAAAVDFSIGDLEIKTEEPFDGEKIVFGVETTLSANPSGNGLFDTFLANAQVVVKFSGMFQMP